MGGHKLTGTLTFGAGGGGGGGGGGGSATTDDAEAANQAIDNSLNELAGTDLTDPNSVDQETIDTVNSLVADSASNADEVTQLLVDGIADPGLALDTVSTLSNVLAASGDLNTGGSSTQSTDTLVSTLNSVGGVFNAITTGGALSTSEVSTMQSTVESLTENLSANIATSLPDNESRSIANSLGNTLNSVINAGGSLSPALVANVQSVANNLTDAARNSLCDRFEKLGCSGTETQDQNAYVTVLVELTGVKLAPDFENTALIGAITENIASASSVSVNDVIVQLSGGTPVANQALSKSRAFSSETTVQSLISDSIGGSTSVELRTSGSRLLPNISSSGALYPTQISDVRILSEAVPEGARIISSGAALLSQDGVGFVLTPAPKDTAAFVQGMTDSFSASVTLNPNTGAYILESTDAKASITFALEDVSDTSGATGSVTFDAPALDPADPNYKFTINYTDGSSQSMVPFVAEPGFIDSLRLLGALPTIDRSTGVVDIDGLLVKPDLIVRDLNSSEQIFLDNNKDANGVAFAATDDVNGDGVSDYIVLSAEGAQVLYAVQ